MADEHPKDRLNRKLIELLNELRVTLPGVEVLFAFLLALPFTERFQRLTDLQKDVYFATFIATGVASLLLIAPATYHRVRWRYTDRESLGDKERMLVTAHRLAASGTVFLAAAIGGTVFVVTDMLFGTPQAAAVAGTMVAAVACLWYALPLTRRVSGDSPARGDGVAADRAT